MEAVAEESTKEGRQIGLIFFDAFASCVKVVSKESEYINPDDEPEGYSVLVETMHGDKHRLQYTRDVFSERLRPGDLVDANGEWYPADETRDGTHPELRATKVVRSKPD